MPEVGFEPTRTIRPADLKSAPLDLSGIQAKLRVHLSKGERHFWQKAFPISQNQKNAPAGNQTRVSSVAGTYTITVLPALNFAQNGKYQLSSYAT